MTTTQYVLEEKFKYAVKGEQEGAQFLELSPPTSKNIPELAPVRAEIMKALLWAQTQSDVESVEVDNLASDEKEVDSKMIMVTLELAPNIDVSKVILCVSKMLIGKNGLAKVDGESAFTQPLFDSLSITDVYGVTGKFISDFIVPSL